MSVNELAVLNAALKSATWKSPVSMPVHGPGSSTWPAWCDCREEGRKSLYWYTIAIRCRRGYG